MTTEWLGRNEVRALLEAYKGTLRSDNTRAAYVRGLMHLSTYWPDDGSQPLIACTTSRFKAAANRYLVDKAPKPNTFNTYAASWAAWAAFLNDQGILDALPKTPPYIPVEIDQPVRDVPTPDEVRRVWEHLWEPATLESQPLKTILLDRALLTMQAFGAMRLSECQEARVFWWQRGRVTPAGATAPVTTYEMHVRGKGLKHRIVPLPADERVILALDDQCAGLDDQTAIVGLERWAIWDRIGRLFERVVGHVFTPHSLRNFAIETMLASGIPITRVAYVVGHKSIRTTYRYDQSRFRRQPMPDWLSQFMATSQASE